MDRKYDPSWVMPLTGATNMGATCWGNAMLQGLLSLPQYVQSTIESESQATGVVGLMHKFLSEQRQNPTGDYPMWFGRIVAALEHATGISQHNSCADDGLMRLLEQHDDSITQLFEIGYSWEMKCPACDKTISTPRDVDIVTRIPPVLNEPEHVVRQYNAKLADLPVGHPMRGCWYTPQITNMSAWLCTHGDIAEEYRFECCKMTRKNVPRAASLKRLNACIVIRLDWANKRHPCAWVHDLSFPARDDAGQRYLRKYKLCAVVEWSGSATIANGQVNSGGHYWAKVLRHVDGNAGWYCVNDSSVTKCEPPQPNMNAILLFYSLSD